MDFALLVLRVLSVLKHHINSTFQNSTAFAVVMFSFFLFPRISFEVIINLTAVAVVVFRFPRIAEAVVVFQLAEV